MLVQIFEGLQHNTTLTHLRLSNTRLVVRSVDTARCLSKMLQVNKSLTHLDLSGNNTIEHSGICSIFEGLQHNSSIIYLNLTHTFLLYPDTARYLAKMLQVNKCLLHLELSCQKSFPDFSNHIGCVFEGLQQNDTLTELILIHQFCQADLCLENSFPMDSNIANYLIQNCLK